MLGIGHRLDKQTKIKVLAQKAKEYNQKYDQLLSKGVEPQEAAKTLSQEQFNRRHQQPCQKEPYNVSKEINPLGGTVNLGYMQSHKTMTQTQAMQSTMKNKLKQTKERGFSDSKKTPEDIKEFNKMKERIYKDHLQEDADIKFDDKKQSNYQSDFVDDEKMNQLRQKRELKYNARKNELIWYAETYIKTKDSLRKC